MGRHLLAFDQGTTSSRALLLDPSGAVTAVAAAEFTQHFPKPGWVEHDPMEIWASQSGVAADVISRGGVRLSDIAAIGITNPARDRHRLEPPHRPAGLQCDCLAGPPHRRPVRSPARPTAASRMSRTAPAS